MKRNETQCAGRSMSRPAIVAALLAASMAGYGAGARAHAFLDRALPAVGSTVHESPPAVNLWFTQALEPAFSKIEIVDDAGRRVDRGDVQVDANDPTILKVSLPPLTPGSYKVIWRVISIDTHMTEGDYRFRLEAQ
jgi:copper resistance protein C